MLLVLPAATPREALPLLGADHHIDRSAPRPRQKEVNNMPQVLEPQTLTTEATSVEVMVTSLSVLACRLRADNIPGLSAHAA